MSVERPCVATARGFPLQADGVADDVAAGRGHAARPARARLRERDGVEAFAVDDHEGVTGVGVDRDVPARARLRRRTRARRSPRGSSAGRRRAARRRPSPSSHSRPTGRSRGRRRTRTGAWRFHRRRRSRARRRLDASPVELLDVRSTSRAARRGRRLRVLLAVDAEQRPRRGADDAVDGQPVARLQATDRRLGFGPNSPSGLRCSAACRRETALPPPPRLLSLGRSGGVAGRRA